MAALLEGFKIVMKGKGPSTKVESSWTNPAAPEERISFAVKLSEPGDVEDFRAMLWEYLKSGAKTNAHFSTIFDEHVDFGPADQNNLVTVTVKGPRNEYSGMVPTSALHSLAEPELA